MLILWLLFVFLCLSTWSLSYYWLTSNTEVTAHPRRLFNHQRLFCCVCFMWMQLSYPETSQTAFLFMQCYFLHYMNRKNKSVTYFECVALLWGSKTHHNIPNEHLILFMNSFRVNTKISEVWEDYVLTFVILSTVYTSCLFLFPYLEMICMH